MALKTLRVGAAEIRLLTALTDGPWDRSTIENALVRQGWAAEAPDGRPAVEWGGGAAAPHFFGTDPPSAGIGPRLELGAAPGTDDGQGASFVQLPCALFWPAFGEEPPLPHGRAAQDDDLEDPETDYDEDEDGEEDGGTDLDEADDLDGEYGPAWHRAPDARRAHFRAEYARLSGLIRAELGAPLHSTSGEMDTHEETWERAGLSLTLHRGDDLNTYSHYDVITVRVGPTAAGDGSGGPGPMDRDDSAAMTAAD
ncbi:hypothetical protein ACIBCB_20630 [Streptomyces uncialis]|uniref:hypothetical protein n=1 Tax=Streptomyces uncialis TaxID=1048205 RepID=UPI0037A5E397